ncbi:MAG TPA: VTT domain-containing protein [Anaerolineales bacterium]|nr:VTT domain-containing protein [Anaerolineales bacterium]
MSDFLLTQIINYGAPILGLIVFIGAMGAPFPGTLIVIAVGAFTRQGLLAWHTTGLIALTCVVLGDCLSYGMGFYARGPALQRFQKSKQWEKAEETFNNWGGMAVVWTRFLLTGIAVPVNLIAGTSGFGIRRFLLYDIIGETVWIFGYGGLGYLFGTQWEVVSNILSNMSGLSLGLVLLTIGIWLGIRWIKTIETGKTEIPGV